MLNFIYRADKQKSSVNDKIISDPDFEDFDGRYVDNTYLNKPSPYNHAELVCYMKKNNKSFEQLSKEEIEQFRIR